jgi:hypothetical protein
VGEVAGNVGLLALVIEEVLLKYSPFRPVPIPITVYVYVPAASSEMVLLVSVPVVITFPGLLVNCHDPKGNPFKTTLPVPTAQVGCVIVPTIGAADVAFTIKLLKLVDPVTAGLLLTTLIL